MAGFANVRAWREAQAEGDEFTLSSGLRVRIRKYITVFDLVQNGGVPMPLVSMAAAREVALRGFDTPRFDFEKMGEYIEVLNCVVSAALIYPKVTTDPAKRDDETITIDELTVQERLLIYGEVAQASELLPFRNEPAPGETDSGNGDQEPETPKRGARANR